jgi:hypothetical protein
MKKEGLLVWIALMISNASFAQSIMSNTVSIKAKNQKLHEVLTIIGNESNVTFSYNTKTINRDSLVTIQATNKPLSEVLRSIFNSNYEFKESGSYIIIRRKPISTSSVISKPQSKQEYYIVNGYVVDDETGEKIQDVSIYETQHLISSMTDANGFFSLKLKNKYPSAFISISKNEYRDTSIQIQASYNHNVEIALIKKDNFPISVAKEIGDNRVEDVKINDPIESKIESKWISNLLLSSKQKIRSLNLKKFYTNRNYQVSLWPSIGTHGKMNAQVANKFSLNVIGGYAGGVNGFEIGGCFNLVKHNVSGIQIGGLFNIVGGKIKGYQIAGWYNETGDTTEGVQIAGLMNVAKKEVNGVQIAGICNKAKSITGVQIGLINSTLSQTGTSIGLLNFSKNKKGKRRVAFLVRFPRGK